MFESLPISHDLRYLSVGYDSRAMRTVFYCVDDDAMNLLYEQLKVVMPSMIVA
jgi:hypothetical protein